MGAGAKLQVCPSFSHTGLPRGVMPSKIQEACNQNANTLNGSLQCCSQLQKSKYTAVKKGRKFWNFIFPTKIEVHPYASW